MNEGNTPTQYGDDPAETPTLQFSLFLLIFAFHSLVIIRQLPRLVQIRHISRYLADKMGPLHGRIKRLRFIQSRHDDCKWTNHLSVTVFV